MDEGALLPWWGLATIEFSDSVVQDEPVADEAMIAAFLVAGASGAESAESFVAANSLHLAGVLEALGRDEIVFSDSDMSAKYRSSDEWPEEAKALGKPSFVCRSRLLGMPLADRHAAINVACCLAHRLPRRALANFLCRLVFGVDVSHFRKAGRPEFSLEVDPLAASSGRGGMRRCPCGRQALGTGDEEAERGKAEKFGYSTTGRVEGASPACRPCLSRRAWMDSVSARLLAMTCRKLRWGRTHAADEDIALERCLSALSWILARPPPSPSRPEVCGSDDSAHLASSSTSSSSCAREDRFDRAQPAGCATASSRFAASTVAAASSDASGSAVRDKDLKSVGCVSHGAGRKRGTSALLARVRSQRSRCGEISSYTLRTRLGSARRHSVFSPLSTEDKRCGAEDDGEPTEGMQPPTVTKKTASGALFPPPQGSASTTGAGTGRPPDNFAPVEKPAEDLARGRPEEGTSGGINAGGNAITSTSETAQVAAEAVDGRIAREGNADVVTKEEEGRDSLSPDMREQLSRVAERVAAAGARGVTSVDVQGAAAAAISLLQAAVMPSARATHTTSVASPHGNGPQPYQTLQAVCEGLGLHASGGKGRSGCGDDLVMAVCKGFVNPNLSLKNCLTFVRAVLVPRARSLTAPASRLLVTAVSDIGTSRPEAVIDGLILPLLCEGEPSRVGSAQCELCTRLIKQVLPKHTLEAVLVGICRPKSSEDVKGGSSARGAAGAAGGDGHGQDDDKSCTLTELTTPVITAALNLKPPLSNETIDVVVRRIVVVSEDKQLQKSLKFTTLLHGLVTRYGPQLKPFLPEMRAAIGRCSTFMVKAVIAALQRLET